MSELQIPKTAIADDEWAEALQNLVGFVQTLIEIDKQREELPRTTELTNKES